MGPVQVLVVGLDQPSLHGEVLAELARLGEAGIVRLVDLLLVRRGDDGTFETLETPSWMPSGLGELTAAVIGGPAGDAPPGYRDPSSDSLWSLADAVPPGTTAAVALLEHAWAGPLRDAIRRAGGRPLEETWLDPADVDVLVSQAFSSGAGDDIPREHA
jgi:Family of unknown function (DUF6325)